MSSAHSSTAPATASSYFLLALYCSAPPPLAIAAQILPCRRGAGRSGSQRSLQYRVAHAAQRTASSGSSGSGAAQAVQSVRIILPLMREGARRLPAVVELSKSCWPVAGRLPQRFRRGLAAPGREIFKFRVFCARRANQFASMRQSAEALARELAVRH